MKKSKLLLVSLLSVVALGVNTSCSKSNPWKNKTVIIHTSNIRGDVDKLDNIAGFFDYVVEQGGDPILVDTGNFLQGSKYTTYDSGETMVKLMMDTGYSAAAIGSHEFDFGVGKIGVEAHEVYYEDGTLGSFVQKYKLNALSINAKKDDKAIYDDMYRIRTEDNNEVVFVGVTDTNTSNYVVEANLEGITFDKETVLQDEILETFAESGSNYKIVLSNDASVKKEDFKQGKVDLVISAPTTGEFAIGAVTIDSKGKMKEVAVKYFDTYTNELISTTVDEFKTKVDADEAFKTSYRSEVTLNGSSIANRSKETNLGDFWTDAMLWYYNNNALKVSEADYTKTLEKDDVVACWNAGNLRDYINVGDVTMKDLQRVLPYPNKLALVKMSGIELVEFLEAASQGLPYSVDSNAALASFMQVAGIEYSIDKSKTYTKGEAYGTNWFKDGNVGSRVTISKINGKAFDQTKTYGVIVSNAVANGMDSNYLCKTEGREKVIFDTVVRDAVLEYIKTGLNGVISSTYAAPEGRIIVK